MDQLIPSLEVLLAVFAPAFRYEVHALFCQMVAAWIVCLGRRTISRVWETTGQAEKRNHAAAFRLFSAAAWNWDEVCRLLLLVILATLVPGVRVWLVVDDTLCHKRGAKTAFGGIFLDAVLSSKRHKMPSRPVRVGRQANSHRPRPLPAAGMRCKRDVAVLARAQS